MMRQSKQYGVSLVELLIALAIFGVIMLVASMATMGSLNFNLTQQVTLSAQSKLRRVSEAVSQDFRGALFGSITDSPYSSNSTQVSFYIADKGAGYEVLEQPSFATSTAFEIISDEDPGFNAGSTVILFDSGSRSSDAGRALAYPITSSNYNSTDDVSTLNHTCQNTFAYGANSRILAYGARSIGIEYDPAEDKLWLTEGGDVNNRVPLAFNITDFSIEYVYRIADPSGTVIGTEANPVPYRSSGELQRIYQANATSNIYTLIELQFNLETEQSTIGNRLVSRSYNAKVPLLSPDTDRAVDGSGNAIFSFQGVGSC